MRNNLILTQFGGIVRYFGPVFVLALLLVLVLLAGCTPRQQGIMTWHARDTPTVSQEQALAECRYDIVKDRTNFEQLFLMSGQPAIRADGAVQGLSSQGVGMFQLCMQAHGYDPAGMIPVQ